MARRTSAISTVLITAFGWPDMAAADAARGPNRKRSPPATLPFGSRTMAARAPKQAGRADVPRLAQLCVDELLRTAERLRSAGDVLESSSNQLLERKLQLQLELGEVCESLEEVHVTRKALAASRQQLIDDVREELDEPLGSTVLARILAVCPPHRLVRPDPKGAARPTPHVSPTSGLAASETLGDAYEHHGTVLI